MGEVENGVKIITPMLPQYTACVNPAHVQLQPMLPE